MAQASVDNLSNRLSSIAAQVGRQDLVESVTTLSIPTLKSGAAIAFIGEFGRGKTTLLNALLGIELLPSGGLPMQHSYTIVSAGEPLAVNAHFVDGTHHAVEATTDALAALEQSATPKLDYLNIEAPIEFTSAGVTLLESPGLGDINPAHRQLTEHVLSLATDVVFVLDASVALDEIEKLFLQRLPQHIRNLLVVINKIEVIDAHEHRRIVELVAEQTVKLGLGAKPTIYKLSARRVLENQRARIAESDSEDWISFLKAIRGLAGTPASVTAVESRLHRLRVVADDLGRALKSAEAMPSESSPEPEQDLDADRRTRRQENLARSRDQLIQVIDDQIADMLKTTTDSFDARAYQLDKDLKAGTLRSADAVLQQWVSEEESRARTRLIRLFRNVLEEIHHATHESIEAEPDVQPVRIEIPVSAHEPTRIPSKLRTISAVGGGVAAIVAATGGLGLVTSVSAGGLVAFALWTVLSRSGQQAPSCPNLGETRNVILRGFEDNFQRNARQLKILVQEHFEATSVRLEPQSGTASASPKPKSDQSNRLLVELEDIRRELERLENA